MTGRQQANAVKGVKRAGKKLYGEEFEGLDEAGGLPDGQPAGVAINEPAVERMPKRITAREFSSRLKKSR
jgi:hypothetical protein